MVYTYVLRPINKARLVSLKLSKHTRLCEIEIEPFDINQCGRPFDVDVALTSFSIGLPDECRVLAAVAAFPLIADSLRYVKNE